MKRKAVVIDQCIHSSTLIMVDINNAKDILPYVMTNGIDKEFREIRDLLKENLRNAEKYKKADVSNKARDIFEMRFIKGERNDRIYCKEVSFRSKRFIIMIELYKGKKSQDIPKSIKSRIETMGGYEYELEY